MGGRVGRGEEIMRVSIVLVIVLLPLSASLARAQQQSDQGAGVAATLQAAPAAPVVYPALNSQPFGTEHLLGDWWGARHQSPNKWSVPNGWEFSAG